MKTLKIAKDLSLPLELVTQSVAIIAKRRAGKSYTMRRIIEQLFKADQQVVLVDPKGDQWGIRSAADGKNPGLPIIILGGEHGDVPLEPSAGEIVAKLVVEERVSVLLDISLFRKHEVARFMAEFLETLYRLKAKEAFRTPLCLVVDEADAIAPQKPQKGEERMLGAAEDIVRRGGQRGIGCILVTQRSAVLNKNVLTQAQIMVALRTIAPQDLSAMDAWIQVHGEPDQRKTLMESLPSLPVGDAWFWSPGWPTTEGIFKRVHVLPIDTFDSGATPKPGEKRIQPKNIADIDMNALKKQMAATIEKAKADDPRELRRQLSEANKKIVELERQKPAAKTETKTVEVPIFTENHIKRIEKAIKAYHGIGEKVFKLITQFDNKLFDVDKAVMEIDAAIHGKVTSVTPARSVVPQKPVLVSPKGSIVSKKSHSVSSIHEGIHPSEMTDRAAGFGKPIPQGERAVLTAVAQYPDGIEREGITVITQYKRSSRDAYIQRLREKGYVECSGNKVLATHGGINALGTDFKPLPTGADLRSHLLSTLPAGESSVLGFLIAAYPNVRHRDEISEATGYQRSSRDAYLQRLSARQLVVSTRSGMVKASDRLF